MGDLVTCKECGTRYDSSHGFCPHCGSTARGSVLPAAVAVAQRRDPGRRRVQASGALLLIVGALFLVSSLAGLAVPLADVAKQFAQPMADQPGGTLVLVPTDERPFDVDVADADGDPIANATGHVGEYRVSSPKHATMIVSVTGNGTVRNGTVVVLRGDTLRVEVDDLADDVQVSSTLRKTVQVGRIAFIAVALALAAGGSCAILLRLWPLAVAAAIVGVLLAAIVLLGFLLAGLLFAVPFGVSAYFILRGRRYFQRKGQ